MKKYDVIIIGAGGGAKLRPVIDHGYSLAIIEKEDPGGTCLNRGCIPSKMLIHTAEVIDEIRDAHRFNINVDADGITVDFAKLTKRVTGSVSGTADKIATSYTKNEKIDYYPGHGRFVSDKVIEVDGKQITANKIFIATGTRPAIPPIEGLEGTPYMTSREALRATDQPKKMIVIGGGYIATELGNFYGVLGTEVHFLVRSRMLKGEDVEVAEEFTRVFKERFNVHMGVSPTKVEHDGSEFTVHVDGPDGPSTMTADALFVATGVRPNSDDLGLEKTAIETNEKGYIQVNDKLETAVPGVYALGDIIGRYLFRHSVNFEGEYLLRTLFTDPVDEKIKYPPMPHAVFATPEIAGVGATEEELKAQNIDYIVGRNNYSASAKGGDAWMSEYGFCKLLFDRSSRKLLGAHIIGKESSNMIHMCIAYMNMNATLDDMLRTIYIHPALPEIVRNAARKARKELEMEW